MQRESTAKIVQELRQIVASTSKEWASHLIAAILFELIKLILHLMVQ